MYMSSAWSEIEKSAHIEHGAARATRSSHHKRLPFKNRKQKLRAPKYYVKNILIEKTSDDILPSSSEGA